METKKQKSKKFINLCKKYGVNADNVAEVYDFKSACKITGDDPKLPIIRGAAKRHIGRMLSDYQLSIIAEAIKNMLRVDYTDMSQWKYFAAFEVKADKKRPSGFGLSFYDYAAWHSHSGVGVRLCFPTRDQAIFFGNHFLKLHVDHHLYT